MELSTLGLKDRAQWEAKGYQLPQFDRAAVTEATRENPCWIHFGAGNIFRAFQANVVQNLLNDGILDRGLIVAEGFDYEIVEKMNHPHDDYTILVTLKADGNIEKTVVGSVVESLTVNTENASDFARLKEIFAKDSLQMVTFTITEKGYSLVNGKGELLPDVEADFVSGPEAPKSYIGKVAALLYARYQAGEKPVAMVSMDNCSHNGEKLRASVMEIVAAWVKNGLVPADFEAYVNDEARVSFPWSMIDKITPRPAEIIEKQLMDAGFEDMQPVITSRNTYIAPFVNAEVPQYLVVEDRFPNGRPALDKAGVYLCDRKTVNDTERMKVTTCLNPLHTALAVYGCLLGYTSIAAEMKDAELVKLVKTIGYKEGLPVVTDPGIISPKAFIDEVVGQRLPNPFIPDTPQRIATDTSQKVGIRFGETIKSYMTSDTLNPADLTAIPLALAGWIRYLIGVDDNGAPMNVSSDPMLATLQAALAGVTLGQPDSVDGKLEGILGNASIFGVSLYTAGLADKVTADVKELLAGPGAVRATLKKHLA